MPKNILKRLSVTILGLWLIAYCLLLIAAPEPERLSVYAPQARYNLPVVDIDGRQYVGAFELIEPLSAAVLKVEGSKWKLRIPDPRTHGKTEAEAEFQAGSTMARIRGARITLSAPVRDENHRLMLPLHGIGAVLIPLVGTDVVFHEASRRLFLGGTAETISSELRKSDPSTLTLRFPAPVNPNINSEGNSIKLSFTRDPVVSFTENEPLNDKLFNSASFAESNGTATLTINANAPLLATFADGGKTIVIASAPAPPSVTASAPSQPSPATAAPQTATETAPQANVSEAVPTSNPQLAEHVPRPAGFLVVIDPGHGGSDTGARITPSLQEKNITLSMARKLRQELQARHVAVTMLRDSDTDLSSDQRAVATNLAKPAAFISLHAEPGTMLRIYTPALPVTSTAPVDRNSFLPWQTAQAAFGADSKSLASMAAEAFAKQEIATQVRPAFTQPLHSIAAPAIAIEIPANSSGTRIPQDQIARTLAEAISARKAKSGGTQ